MKAIILCGGFGVRFPMTPARAKALLKVDGKPLVEHIVKKLDSLKDVEKIYISTNRKFAEDFEKWLDACSQKGVELVVEESRHQGEKMGALGALDFVIKEKGIEGDLLVINGDNLFEDDLVSLVKALQECRYPVLGLYKLKDLQEARKFGVVETDEKRKIISFLEKPENPVSRLVSTGIYAFPEGISPKLREYLDAGQNPDAPGNFLGWLHKREEVRGFELKGVWFDIGNEESYEKARKFFEKQVDAMSPKD